MKKIVFMSMFFAISLALVSCGTAQNKKNNYVRGGYTWSERAAEKMNWDEAKEYCEEAVDEDGNGGYRLPSPQEFAKIFSQDTHSSLFGDNDTFWTSEEINENRARSFEFSFANRDSASKSTKFAVRCVKNN